MKKIIAAAIVMVSAVTFINAQNQEYTALNEKKSLKSEKKGIDREGKEIKKEERISKRSEVSYTTKEEFRLDFPKAIDPVFHVGKQFEEVFYTLGGQPFTAFYDLTSTLVGTTTVKQFNDLPSNAQRRINEKYVDKGYKIDRVILFDDNEASPTDMWLYEQPFDDTDIYFVELSRLGEELVLQVDLNGDVSFFKQL